MDNSEVIEKNISPSIYAVDKLLSNVQAHLKALSTGEIDTKVEDRPPTVSEYSRIFNEFYQVLDDIKAQKVIEPVIAKALVSKSPVKAKSKPAATIEQPAATKYVPKRSPDVIVQKIATDKKKIEVEESELFEIFNSTNLTEDYELGIRLYKNNLKTLFVNQRQNPDDPKSVIAVGEHFPNTFWTTVKQRSRWIAGIVLQSWAQYGWDGTLKNRYFLFRDRKIILNAFGSFLSNILFMYFLYSVAVTAFTSKIGYGYTMVSQDSPLWSLMLMLIVFMLWRLAHRMYFTYKWYGFWYALTSPFRLLMDNFINFVALNRAFVVYRRNKKYFSWDSTTHY